MLRRLRDEERGVAMVVALSVAFVVMLLSTVVVAQAIHSVDSSGYDRERLLSVNAAEAGTNRWYAYLQTTPSLSMAADAGCSSSTGKLTLSDTVQSGPATAAYSAVGTFYASDGTTTMSCATFSDTNFPAYVKVRSTGTINGAPNRTLETYVRLTPNYGGFGAAILAVNGTTISNSFTVNGNSGNDGDIYILNGNFRVTNSMTLSGNIYVPNGTAQIENTSTVKGNVWANGDVTLQNSATMQRDDQGHHGQQQHELQQLHGRVLLHAVRRVDEQPERLRGTGPVEGHHDRQQLQDDLQAGAGPRDHGRDRLQAGHLLHPRVS